MIRKFYEIRCDYCDRVITHFPIKKPTKEQMEAYGIVYTGTKQFCSELCHGDWNHDRQERQYLNLKQKGRIHNNG